MKKFLAFAVIAASLVASAPQAKADTFVWKDPVNDYTMSFPDVWRVQTPDDAYTRLRIAGPLGEDHAVCRMQVFHDGRVQIYPKYLLDKAVSEKLDRNFWEGRISEFNKARIINFYDPASLGDKGDATAVNIALEKNTGEGMSPMRGFMIGSIYGKDRFEVTCYSKADVYERWADLFLSIIDSVQLESKYHPFPTGYYRGFLNDPKLQLPTDKPGTRDPHAASAFWGTGYHH
jgi:hypothetical protein